MRDWQPEKKPKLPPPDFEYLEREAAKDALIPANEWPLLNEVEQARIIAHYIHSRSREAYEMEAAMKEGEKNAGKKDNGGMSPEEYVKSRIVASHLTGQPGGMGFVGRPSKPS